MAERKPAPGARYGVATRWDVRIRARDGVELSANLWLPVEPGGGARDGGGDGASEAGGNGVAARAGSAPRFPVILEMIPYGKDNWRRNGDVARGEWLAARGFALCRVDVRGTGSSGGIALDEYTADETRDGYDAVEWLAAQPWCTGAVGMWGISYGGFTAIQVAKLRPPHLRAIAPMYATDDRYLDDVHVRGGCLTASELSQYAVSQLAMNAMPPDDGFRGPGWRDEWRARLDATPPWLLGWWRQQTDGPYWRQGSLAPDWEALECAVFHVAGWSDAYVDAAFRMQERCVNARRRTLVGNWVHSFPDDAYPGPNLNWYEELLRFFDRHLRDADNGWDDEPALTWFERGCAPPEPFPAAWPGRWRAAAAYPVPGVEEAAWSLAGPAAPGEGGRLVPGGAIASDADRDGTGASDDLARQGATPIPHRATTGTSGALCWGAGWHPNGLARDLRPDEARGATWTSPPLAAPVSVIGVPRAGLHLSATMPVATAVVRLSDVAPDGTSALVATGVLNLTHRRSHTDPAPLEPGRVEAVEIPLRATGYRWAPGHRVRLTVLTSYWPALWPSPFPGELRVHHGGATPSRLVLPVLPDDVPGPEPPAFRTGPAGLRAVGGGDEDPPVWRVEEDVIAGTVTVTIREGGTTLLEDGRSLYSAERLTMTASDPDPARVVFDSDVVYRWDAGTFRSEIRATATVVSDAGALDARVALEVDLDGARFFERAWTERIPRRLV